MVHFLWISDYVHANTMSPHSVCVTWFMQWNVFQFQWEICLYCFWNNFTKSAHENIAYFRNVSFLCFAFIFDEEKSNIFRIFFKTLMRNCQVI